MEKLLYLKNREGTAEKQKFIFLSIEKPSGQASGTGTLSLAETMEKKFNTNLNVETPFSADFNAVLENLGNQAKEKNPELSAESVRQNLTDTLDPGKTLDEIRDYLQSKGCRTAAIVDGRFKFFAGPKGVQEIFLSEFFKPREVKIGGEGTYTHEYLLKKEAMMSQTMQALQALKGELPENPPNKIS